MIHHGKCFTSPCSLFYLEQRKEKNTRILQEKNNLGHHEKELINQQMSTQ